MAYSVWCCAFEFLRTPSTVVSRGDAIVPSLHLYFLLLFSLSMESFTRLKYHEIQSYVSTTQEIGYNENSRICQHKYLLEGLTAPMRKR